MMSRKVFIITGTSAGLGKALSRHYLAHGQTVIGCSRGPASVRHRQYSHTQLDVTDESAVVRFVAQVQQKHGRVDVLVNNAGVASMNHLLTMPVQNARHILDTNVLGSFLVLREVAKKMVQKKRGRIVNFTSLAVPLHLAGEAMYAASKSAIESLTVTAAKELGPFGITVNAVGPTVFPTALTRTVPKDKLCALRAMQAIPRDGRMDDLTNAIDFFLSPRSSFITGQVIYLGGIHG